MVYRNIHLHGDPENEIVSTVFTNKMKFDPFFLPEKYFTDKEHTYHCKINSFLAKLGI